MPYVENKALLKKVCGESRVIWSMYEYPFYGDIGEMLTVDVYTLRPKSTKFITIMSGTHGLEGEAGSHAQIKLIKRIENLSTDIGVMIIHAINPWGYLHNRRVDNENIDVNRGCGTNFETQCKYADVRNLIEPEHWTEDSGPAIARKLTDPDSKKTFQQAVTGGQYDFPKGLFYGGKRMCQSGKIIQMICNNFLTRVKYLSVIDIHTGIGPIGKGTILSPLLPNEDRTLTDQMFGKGIQYISDLNPNAISSKTCGDAVHVFIHELPNTTVVPIGIEVGTVSIAESISRMAEENFLWHQRGNDEESLLRHKKMSEEFKRECFCPLENTTWKSALEDTCDSALETMISGLQNL